MPKPWSEGLTVRPLTAADLEWIAGLEAGERSAWSLAQIRAELERPHGGLAVAAVDRMVVGWGCVCACGSEAELLKLNVLSDCRRRGVGTALLSFLTAALRRCGADTLFLEVRARNRGAVAFYRRRGFTAVGRRISYYSRPVDDALVLKNVLRPGLSREPMAAAASRSERAARRCPVRWCGG